MRLGQRQKCSDSTVRKGPAEWEQEVSRSQEEERHGHGHVKDEAASSQDPVNRAHQGKGNRCYLGGNKKERQRNLVLISKHPSCSGVHTPECSTDQKAECPISDGVRSTMWGLPSIAVPAYQGWGGSAQN